MFSASLVGVLLRQPTPETCLCGVCGVLPEEAEELLSGAAELRRLPARPPDSPDWW